MGLRDSRFPTSKPASFLEHGSQSNTEFTVFLLQCKNANIIPQALQTTLRKEGNSMREHASTLAFDAEFVEVGTKLLRSTALALFLSMHRDGYHLRMVEDEDGRCQLFRSIQKGCSGLSVVE